MPSFEDKSRVEEVLNNVWDDTNSVLKVGATDLDIRNLAGATDGVGLYLYNGTNFQAARMDKYTRSIQTIEYEHHEIHAGSSFTCSYDAEIANGANLDLLIVTPNTTSWAHLTYEIDVELETQMYLYEAPTATAAANPVVAYNRDRNNITAATVVVTHTPTGITPGTTIIRSHHLGSGKQWGGGARGVHEFILKQNTKYLFRLTNATVSNNWMSVKLDWYEHTNQAA